MLSEFLLDSLVSEVRKMHLSRVPKNVSIVPEIRSFHELPRLTNNDDLGMRSGVIELANGTVGLYELPSAR